MPGMTKEVLRQKIMEFGETPPESWRKNQLEARLVELKEQNPEAKVHDLLKEMNKAAKKKHDLQVFLTQKLGITITGNETISRLLSLGNQAIMENKPPLATDVMGFGKFAPLTYQDVQEQHPDYTGWSNIPRGDADDPLPQVGGPEEGYGQADQHEEGLHECEQWWGSEGEGLPTFECAFLQGREFQDQLFIEPSRRSRML